MPNYTFDRKNLPPARPAPQKQRWTLDQEKYSFEFKKTCEKFARRLRDETTFDPKRAWDDSPLPALPPDREWPDLILSSPVIQPPASVEPLRLYAPTQLSLFDNEVA